MSSVEVAISQVIRMSLKVLKKQYPDLYRQVWDRGLKAAKNRQYVAKRKARIQSSAGLILF
jgi:hypothetical protein